MLHYFNPGHETAVLNGSRYYMPPATQLKMRADLAYLPAWYAQPEDFIFVEKKPSEDFWASIQALRLPPAIDRNDFMEQKTILENQTMECWGITPADIHLFSTFNKKYRLSLSLPVWHDQYKTFCSRIFACNCLQHITKDYPEIKTDIVPQIYDNLSGIELQLKLQPGRYLAKAVYSSSGQGLVWLPEGTLSQSARQIIQGRLNKQGCISLERVLDKVLDFAMEFRSTANGQIYFTGYSLFQTTQKGGYAGNLLMPQSSIYQKIAAMIPAFLLEKIQHWFQKYLQENVNPFYKGIIGVDMMIYRQDNRFYLHPCVEMNMRHNMGTLSVALHGKHLHTNATGLFSIDYDAQKGAQMKKDREMQQQHPVFMENDRIRSGYLSLCPVNDDSQYRAYIVVNSSYQQ